MRARSFDLALVSRPRLASRSNIALVAAGVIALAASLVSLFDAGTQVQHLRARLGTLQPGPRQEAARLSREELRALNDQIRAVNRHIDDLNMAWDEVFRAVRVPEGIEVVLIGLESTGRSGVLRLHGETGRFEAMTDYVDVLAQRNAFAGAQLVRHEVPKDSPKGPYRFMVEAAWRR